MKALIESADRSISAKDFDGLMRFYTDDAALVVKAGMYAKGKDQIRKAFEAISAHFQGKLKVRQGRMEVIEGGDTALIIMETWLGLATAPLRPSEPFRHAAAMKATSQAQHRGRPIAAGGTK